MLEKRLQYQRKEFQEEMEECMGMLFPTCKDLHTLYRHWLKANQELLEGFSQVLDRRLAALEKFEKPAKRKEKKVKVQ